MNNTQWKVGAGTSRGHIIYEVATDRVVAFVVDSPADNGFAGKESEENAHVIAAAPDLLQALKSIWESLTPGQQGCAGHFRASTPVVIPYSTLGRIKQVIDAAEGTNAP